MCDSRAPAPASVVQSPRTIPPTPMTYRIDTGGPLSGLLILPSWKDTHCCGLDASECISKVSGVENLVPFGGVEKKEM